MRKIGNERWSGVQDCLGRSIALLFAAVLAQSTIAHAEADMGMEKTVYGKLPDGVQVDLYTLTNSHGLVCNIITYGGIITELHVPDRDGKSADVVLGCDSLKAYEQDHSYYGAILGRVANRIAKGRFTLDGKTYTLATRVSTGRFGRLRPSAGTMLFHFAWPTRVPTARKVFPAP
jgi:hypothetical protein